MFWFAQINKNHFAGEEKWATCQFPVLLCTFPGKGTQIFTDRGGGGAVSNPGHRDTGKAKGQISLAGV